jgi:DNA-binding NtrC family response regulator
MSVPVAIVCAEPPHWEKLSGIISSCGLQPVRCETLAAANKLSPRRDFELAISDDELPDGSFRELIAQLKRSGHSTPVVAVSRFDDRGSCLQAMIAAAFEYVAFPPYPHELEQAVAAALAESQASRKRGANCSVRSMASTLELSRCRHDSRR